MQEIEHKKRCACKHLWWIRNKPTPSADKANRAHPTWQEWYMKTFNEPMGAVWGRIQADNQAAKNRATKDFYMKMGR